jgi:hypothetical protein
MNMKHTDWTQRLVKAPADGGAGSLLDTAAPAAEPNAQAAPADDHSWVPEQFVKDGKPDFTALRTQFDELSTFKAQRDEAAATIPESADGYDLAVPADLSFGEMELPEGFKFELANDERTAPLLGELRDFLHKNQLPAEAGPALLGMMARYEAMAVSDGYANLKREKAALGSNADARMTEVSRALEAKLPADLATALKAAATTANGVRALEKLLSAPALSAGTTTAPGADTESMTPSQRLAYANSQSAQTGRSKRN